MPTRTARSVLTACTSGPYDARPAERGARLPQRLWASIQSVADAMFDLQPPAPPRAAERLHPRLAGSQRPRVIGVLIALRVGSMLMLLGGVAGTIMPPPAPPQSRPPPPPSPQTSPDVAPQPPLPPLPPPSSRSAWPTSPPPPLQRALVRSPARSPPAGTGVPTAAATIVSTSPDVARSHCHPATTSSRSARPTSPHRHRNERRGRRRGRRPASSALPFPPTSADAGAARTSLSIDCSADTR